MPIPEALVQQFRTVAIDRLDHIEAAWNQIQEQFDESAAATIHREIHTLKGESKMLGFADVNLVCHKAEELLDVARVCGYAVDAELDFSINMALQFMAMLVRKQAGAPLGGIDLQGFLRQIEAILTEAKQKRKKGASGPMPKIAAAPPTVSAPLRTRLGPIAIDLFVEYTAAAGPRRERLRTSWCELRELLGTRAAAFGVAQLDKHVAGARAVGRELGKQLEISIEMGTVEVTPPILAALDVAMVHLLRNAVDHGIEPPAARLAAGKAAAGVVSISGSLSGGELTLVVKDDGAGVSLERVRTRALELGLVSPTADIASCWIDLVCAPGFSTRNEASDVSGRGVGLDAVRSSVVELGGTLAVTTEAGRGTSWRIAVPVPALVLRGKVLFAPNVPFPLVIDHSWSPAAGHSNTPLVDVAAQLGLAPPSQGVVDVYFARGRDVIGFRAERAPIEQDVRRLVPTPPNALGEIVTVDGKEAMLLRPERWVTT